jgi:hypothetical protein
VKRETRKPRANAKKARRPNGMYRSRGQEPRQYYRALLRGAHAMYRSSVEKSTRKTYKTAEKYWVKLTKRIGTDPYMRTKNPAWLAGDTSFANTTITWEETCVLAFLESTRHKPRKKINAKHSVQLLVRHPKISPRWRGGHRLHGDFAIY